MTGGMGALFVAVFLACAVEAVEATTIVLAAGTARDWRSALTGLAAGLAGLIVVVGGMLLVFGLQWLRKAVLRASGYKALHDEDQLYRKELGPAQAATSERRGLV